MVMILGLARTSFSSAPAERMFVSCFLRHGFTYRSSDLDDSPMTIPAYTFFSKKKAEPNECEWANGAGRTTHLAWWGG
jgi:hypothetical protein